MLPISCNKYKGCQELWALHMYLYMKALWTSLRAHRITFACILEDVCHVLSCIWLFCLMATDFLASGLTSRVSTLHLKWLKDPVPRYETSTLPSTAPSSHTIKKNVSIKPLTGSGAEDWLHPISPLLRPRKLFDVNYRCHIISPPHAGRNLLAESRSSDEIMQLSSGRDAPFPFFPSPSLSHISPAD